MNPHGYISRFYIWVPSAFLSEYVTGLSSDPSTAEIQTSKIQGFIGRVQTNDIWYGSEDTPNAEKERNIWRGSQAESEPTGSEQKPNPEAEDRLDYLGRDMEEQICYRQGLSWALRLGEKAAKPLHVVKGNLAESEHIGASLKGAGWLITAGSNRWVWWAEQTWCQKADMEAEHVL